jgi:hypothetical protein
LNRRYRSRRVWSNSFDRAAKVDTGPRATASSDAIRHDGRNAGAIRRPGREERGRAGYGEAHDRSFGTLAAIAVVNFKLAPAPEAERSFLLAFHSVAKAIAARNRLLASALQPAALDLLNPATGETLGNRAWLLAIRARATWRWWRCLAFDGARQQTLWGHIGDFTPWFLAAHPDGAVVRVSCTLKLVLSLRQTTVIGPNSTHGFGMSLVKVNTRWLWTKDGVIVHWPQNAGPGGLLP